MNIDFIDFIDPNRIIFFKNKICKTEALFELTDNSQELLDDVEGFYNTVLKRESILSTGFGHGVAFPHAKTNTVTEFFISIGISKEGIEWDAFDDLPVNLILLIGGPTSEQDRYLKLMSSLSEKIKQKNVRESILSAKSPAKVLKVLYN